jgi:hypothetical protein
MRMPPFMRHSNANPLTLSAWQYDLLMKWVAQVAAGPPPPPPPPEALVADAAMVEPTPLSGRAAERRAEVVARLS